MPAQPQQQSYVPIGVNTFMWTWSPERQHHSGVVSPDPKPFGVPDIVAPLTIQLSFQGGKHADVEAGSCPPWWCWRLSQHQNSLWYTVYAYSTCSFTVGPGILTSQPDRESLHMSSYCLYLRWFCFLLRLAMALKLSLIPLNSLRRIPVTLFMLTLALWLI